MRLPRWLLPSIAAGSVALAYTLIAITHSPDRPAGRGAVQFPPTSLAAASSSWDVYHGTALGTGVDASGVSFSPASGAWTSPTLDGQLYGEPLEATGRVFVGTENDTIYALASNTGAVLWSTHVGTPVPNGSLPCGNIAPTVGITGTPVIDESRGELFAVADESNNGVTSHHLVGVDLFRGGLMLDQVVDPAGSSPKALLQRTGLNLSNGNVVFGFGGNYGDCPSYHGWIVSVPEGGGAQRTYEVDSGAGQSEGAVWMGGAAPEVDSSGNIWAAAGNGSVTSSSGQYDFSDSVFELNPQLGLTQYFAPSNWAAQNSADQDLGSTGPAIASNGTVLQVGKSNTGYLLNQGHLNGVGGQIAQATVCSTSDADGGDAVSGADVFVPCGGGLEDVRTSASPPAVSVAWTASFAGGSPIIAGGLVWSIKGGNLYSINPSTGAMRQSISIGSEANHFPTPSVGDGLLLVPTSNHVLAFSGSAGIPGPPSSLPPPAPYVAAFQSAAGTFWTVGGVGWTNWNLGMASGTSPGVARLARGGFEAAFEANTGHLWTLGSASSGDWNLGVAPNTSPSVAGLHGGGFEVAFHASDGHLWTVGTGGWTNSNLGIAPGTSPSIAALAGGGFEVAFQAAGGQLWTVGTGGWRDWSLGMAPRSSPSISGLAGGGFETAFQANNGRLWSVGAAGWTNWNLGLEVATSPSLSSLPGGGVEVAFQSAGGQLWTVGAAGWANWGLGLAGGTSPAISFQPGLGLVTAFQAADGSLWTVGAGGGSWSLGMARASSPGEA